MTTIIEGIITKFKGDGRKLGYPTANLTADTKLRDGVYFGFADLAKWHRHPAIIFIGVPITMGETQRRIEAYLLDIPDKDYYELPLKLEIIYFYRSNLEFKNMEKLISVMKNDERAARVWFANKPNNDNDQL